MAKSDGSVIIDTRMDTKGFSSGAKKLFSAGRSACEKLSSGFRKLGLVVGAALSVGKIIQFGAESSKAARELSDALTGLQSIVEGQGRSFADAQSFIEEYTSDGLVPATNAITAYKNLASRGYDDGQIQQTMIALKDAAAFGRQSALSMGDAVQGATEGLKNENSMLVDNAGVTKNVAKMWDDYAASIGTTTNNLTQQQKIQAEVAGILEETKFQTGDAAKVSGTLSGQLQQLSFNFNNLKVAVGGIVNPIVQYVLPTINTVIQAFTRLANAVGQVVGLLFGKVSTSGGLAEQNNAIAETAIAGAEAEKALAKETESAGKAAKKALAGFDELNMLQENTGNGSSNGTSVNASETVSASPVVKVEETSLSEEVVPDFVQMFADKIKAGKWSEVSAELTEKINGMITSVDWKNVGSTIGKYFNSALSFISTAAATFNWAALGKSFADSFMGIWNAIDWAGAGKGLSDGAKGVLTTLSTTIKNINWKKLGTDVAKFIKAIDWSGIFTALSDGVGAALGGLSAFILGLVKKAWQSVVKWWKDNAVKDGKFTMEGLLSGIGETLKNIGKWIKDKIFTPFINGFKKAFGIHSPSTVMAEMGKYLIQGLKNGITNAWKSIKELFTTKLNNIKTTINNAWTAVKNSKAWENIRKAWASKWNEIRDTAGTKFNAAKEKVLAAWTAVKNSKTWDAISTNLSQKWSAIKTNATNSFTNMKTAIVDAFSALKTGLKTPINGVIGFINKLISGVVSGINSMIRALNKLSFSVPSWIPSIGGKSFGFNLSTLTAPSIPYLAKGAVIPPNAPFMAMLGDQRHGTNIEAPLSTIQEAVALVLEDMTGGLMAGFEATVAVLREILEAILGIEIGDTVIAEAVNRYNRKMAVVKGG